MKGEAASRRCDATGSPGSGGRSSRPSSHLCRATRARTFAGRARRTLIAYEAQWRRFADGDAGHALSAPAATPETVVLTDVEGARGAEGCDARAGLTAISQVHVARGTPSPRASALVPRCVRGMQRVHGAAPTQKQPLLVGQLQRVVRALPETLGGARDRALLLIGFAGAFRRSELAALEVADVRSEPEGLKVLVRRSKTDQTGKGHTVAIPRGRDPATCPVRALATWLACAAITEGRLFRSVDRHGNLGGALDGGDIAAIVKRRVAMVGLDPAGFSGHSLRAGLATSAAKAGKSAHSIMKTTGHRSAEMVHRYIRDAELFSDNAASGLL